MRLIPWEHVEAVGTPAACEKVERVEPARTEALETGWAVTTDEWDLWGARAADGQLFTLNRFGERKLTSWSADGVLISRASIVLPGEEWTPPAAASDGVVLLGGTGCELVFNDRAGTQRHVDLSGYVDCADPNSPRFTHGVDVARDGRIAFRTAAADKIVVASADGRPLWAIDIPDTREEDPHFLDARFDAAGNLIVIRDNTHTDAKLGRWTDSTLTVAKLSPAGEPLWAVKSAGNVSYVGEQLGIADDGTIFVHMVATGTFDLGAFRVEMPFGGGNYPMWYPFGFSLTPDGCARWAKRLPHGSTSFVVTPDGTQWSDAPGSCNRSAAIVTLNRDGNFTGSVELFPEVCSSQYREVRVLSLLPAGPDEVIVTGSTTADDGVTRSGLMMSVRRRR